MAIKPTAVSTQLCHQSLTLSPGTFKGHRQAGVMREKKKKSIEFTTPGLKHKHKS